MGRDETAVGAALLLERRVCPSRVGQRYGGQAQGGRVMGGPKRVGLCTRAGAGGYKALAGHQVGLMGRARQANKLLGACDASKRDEVVQGARLATKQGGKLCNQMGQVHTGGKGNNGRQCGINGGKEKGSYDGLPGCLAPGLQSGACRQGISAGCAGAWAPGALGPRRQPTAAGSPST